MESEGRKPDARFSFSSKKLGKFLRNVTLDLLTLMPLQSYRSEPEQDEDRPSDRPIFDVSPEELLLNTSSDDLMLLADTRRPSAATQMTMETFWTAVDEDLEARKPSSTREPRKPALLSDAARDSWCSGESGVAFCEYPSPRIDFTCRLPPEVLDKVFHYLDIKSLCQCSQVSKQWHAATSRNAVWRSQYRSRWDTPADITGMDCEMLYRSRHQLETNWSTAQFAAEPLEGHTDSVYCAEFDKHDIVTGSRDHKVIVWDPQTRTGKHCLTAHDGSVLCLAMDDDLLVTGSSDCHCCIWDRKNGYALLANVEYHSVAVLDVVLHPKYIIACSKDSTIAAINRTTYELEFRLEGHRGPVNAMAVFEDTLISAGGDGLVKQWDLRERCCTRTLRGHTRGLACVDISKCGRYAVSGSNDRTIRLWDLHTGLSTVLEGHTNLVRSLCLTDSRIISASYDGSVKIWDRASCTLQSNLTGLHGSWVFCVRASERHLTDSRIISASYDGSVKIWDRASCTLQSNLTGLHGSWVFCVRASERHVISTSVGIRPLLLDFGAGINCDSLGYL